MGRPIDGLTLEEAKEYYPHLSAAEHQKLVGLQIEDEADLGDGWVASFGSLNVTPPGNWFDRLLTKIGLRA